MEIEWPLPRSQGPDNGHTISFISPIYTLLLQGILTCSPPFRESYQRVTRKQLPFVMPVHTQIATVPSGYLFTQHPSCGHSLSSFYGTYLLTPRSRVLLEKLTGLQLVKKFPAYYGTRRFIAAFTSARHLSLSNESVTQLYY